MNLLFRRNIVRIVFFALTLQLFKITADFLVQRNFTAESFAVSCFCTLENEVAIFIAIFQLIQQKHFILGILDFLNIEADQTGFQHRNHVIEAHHAEPTFIKLHNRAAALNVCVIWLWGFQRDIIIDTVEGKNDPDVRTALTFVVLDTVIDIM